MAFFSCDLTLRGLRSHVEVTGWLLDALTTEFVQMQSAQVVLPGCVARKVESSVDGPRLWPQPSPRGLLPGERLLRPYGVTTLDNADQWLNWKCCRNDILEQLTQTRSEARGLSHAATSLATWVVFRYWGLFKVCLSPDNENDLTWALREEVEPSGNQYREIVRVSCHLGLDDDEEYLLSVGISTDQWPYFSRVAYSGANQPLPSSASAVAVRNIQLYAHGVRSALLALPMGSYQWEVNCESMTDLNNRIVRELERMIGPADVARARDDLGEIRGQNDLSER